MLISDDFKGDWLCAKPIGYQGGNIPQGNLYNLITFTGYDGFSGSLPLGATPEPTSFVLPGTGLLGIAVVVRRRMFA